MAAVERPLFGIDLFCGCGGFSLGSMMAGINVLAAADNDPAAAVTYMCNLSRHRHLQIVFVTEADRERFEAYLQGGRRRQRTEKEIPRAGTGWIKSRPKTQWSVPWFFFGDITKLSGGDMLEVMGIPRDRGDAIGVVFGSPPCQGFSTAGKRDPADPRNNLVFEFLRIALEIGPQTMMFENVPGITSMTTPDGLSFVDAVSNVIATAGFSNLDAVRRLMRYQVHAGVKNFALLKSSSEEARRRRSETAPATSGYTAKRRR